MLVILGAYVVTAPIWPSVTTFKQEKEWEFSIPSIDLYTSFNDIEILEHSSEPAVGNTVITGHRFLYRSPYVPSLYHLDEVEIGDMVEISLNGNLFTYILRDILEVEEDGIWVEGDTNVPIVTVYTCTPLWNSTRRLVVRGELVRIQ